MSSTVIGNSLEIVPGRQRAERRPEARHSSLSPFPEGLLHQLGFRGRIQAPKASFPWLILGTGYFQEVAVERQIVSDRVLEENKMKVYTFCIEIEKPFILTFYPSFPPVYKHDRHLRAKEEGLYLPAFICSAVVWVVFSDVGVDAAESQLFVWS